MAQEPPNYIYKAVDNANFSESAEIPEYQHTRTV